MILMMMMFAGHMACRPDLFVSSHVYPGIMMSSQVSMQQQIQTCLDKTKRFGVEDPLAMTSVLSSQ